ncbi:hypothetical protein [Roseomonas sp. 18066]|uniref:hypothetical protein n=1 Tax=Roseomonas sp. 18066 TaxID=2681412 RepID=UPI00135CDF58|nr:hypothetical protein [Roseomonas sp. 18066]
MRLRAAALLLLAPLLAGCELAGGLAGGLSGAATGTITSNPAVGYAVGVTVRAAADAAMKRWMRGMQNDEQIAIAQAASELAAGDSRPWQVKHELPFGWRDQAGQLAVTRVIDTPLTQCREILFSVQEKPEAPPEGIFVATTCRNPAGWRWASAEPATARWGYLQ